MWNWTKLPAKSMPPDRINEEARKDRRGTESQQSNGIGRSHEQYPRPGTGGCTEGVDLCMKQTQYVLCLSSFKYRLLRHCLLQFRNKLIEQASTIMPSTSL